MEVNKSVYKMDSKGKLRVTTISTNMGQVIQNSGLEGGAKTSHRSMAKPKNVGRANETTIEEQAILEAEAKITKKLKEGYFETVKEAQEEEVIMPMLAKVFEKEQHKIDWSNAFVQPKLDGMRCLDTIDGKLSRKNTPILTMDHINIMRPAALKCAVDGELYAKDLNFQENMRLIKKLRPESVLIKHHIYDVVSKLPFVDRYTIASAIVEASENCELVPTYAVNSMTEVKRYHAQFLSEGYEGTMVRWGTEGYKVNGRSSNLLKYKDFLDIAAEIIDITPSDKNPEQGVIQCSYEEKTFGCGMKFSHMEREEMLTNKKDYIGKKAEIRFFEYSEDGIPRFPVCVGIRLDK